MPARLPVRVSPSYPPTNQPTPRRYAAVIYLIGAALWTLEALWSLWCLKLVYFNFRSGGKQAEAQNEMQRLALNAALQHQMGAFAGGAARK
jgi:hypothetical protein